MLAVAGLAFAYTSCTDYSKDIDENSKEIESLSGRLATAEQQITSLKADVTSLQTAKTEAEKAIAALQTSLSTLQTKHDADVKKLAEDYAKADEALKAEIQKKIDEANAAHEKDVEAVKTLITALQTKVTDLETEVGKINETIKTLATKEYVDATFATKDALTSAEEKIGALRTDLTAAEGKITALEGKYDENVKISEILVKIAAAQKAAHVADSLARKSLGDVDALKTALGVYAEKGALEAKIALLEKADSTLKADKLNISDFNAEFEKALKKTLETEGNVISVEIAKQITTAKTELEGKISDLRKYVDSKFSYLYSVAKQLKSLVFVPDLYVDGIEATEYTYAKYNVMTFKSSGKAGEYTSYEEYGNGVTKVPAKVLNGNWLFKENEKYPTNYSVAEWRGATKTYFKTPSSVVTYKMNPSTADVTEETPLAFISDDKEFVNVNTRTSINGTSVVKFESAKDGELKARLSAKSLEQLCEGQNRDYRDYVNSFEGMVSIFALQATVKNGEGQDTTVTSDFARLYTQPLYFESLAFTKADYTSTIDCGTQDHIYPTLKEAIENAPSVKVKYDETLDLYTVVTTHIHTRQFANVCGDYAKLYPDNDYNVTYEFEYIDYLLGTNTTSETQHMFLNGGNVFTPCGVTTDEGTRDTNAVGADAFTSVGRRPIVRVNMKVDGKLVKVGFIKFEIVKQTDYKMADPFEWTYRFFCGGFTNETTWSEMENKVIKIAGLTKEEFCQMYKIESNGVDNDGYPIAVQYMKDADGNFVKLAGKVDNVNRPIYGTVTEHRDLIPGTTTDILQWEIGAERMSNIYEDYKEHKVTIYVRYLYANSVETTKYDGIYVPLTAVVHKPVATVSKKLSNYWFNNGTSAKINVDVPFNVENGSSKPDFDPKNPTKPWITDIDQVWEGNKPVFDFGTPYYIPGKPALSQSYDYKYYFAPQQQKFTIDGYTYLLVAGTENAVVNNYGMYKKYGSARIPKSGNVTNSAIEGNELAYAIDVTKGIYANNVLWCVKAETKKASNADWTKWTGRTVHKIATLVDDANDSGHKCVVKYNYGENQDLKDAEVAKFLLNYFKSVPPQYTEAKLFANIGVTAYCDENIAMSLKGAINPYYFLRPVNAVAATDKYFVDGADQHVDESNIDVFNALTFKDWRGEKFVNFEAANLADSLKNMWYFKYYNVNSIEIDIENITTTLDGGYLGETKLSDKTEKINIEHWTGERVTPTVVSTIDNQNALVIELNTPANPAKWSVNAADKYSWLVKKFGYIHYHNNGTTIETPFTLRVPVSFTYTWGTINTYVDIQVKPFGTK